MSQWKRSKPLSQFEKRCLNFRTEHWHVYTIINRQRDRYVGISRNPLRRLEDHRKSKRMPAPIRLYFSHYVGNYWQAAHVENLLQKLTEEPIQKGWVLSHPDDFVDWRLFEAGAPDLFNMDRAGKLMYARELGIL